MLIIRSLEYQPTGGRWQGPITGPAIGMINAFGGLGGFAGTYLVGWLGSVTRRFIPLPRQLPARLSAHVPGPAASHNPAGTQSPVGAKCVDF